MQDSHFTLNDACFGAWFKVGCQNDDVIKHPTFTRSTSLLKTLREVLGLTNVLKFAMIHECVNGDHRISQSVNALNQRGTQGP